MLKTFKLKDKNEQEKNCEQCKLKTQTLLSNTTYITLLCLVFGVVFCGLYDYCAFLYMCLCSSTNFYRIISVCDFFYQNFIEIKIKF